jgi:hypothetical protein
LGAAPLASRSNTQWRFGKIPKHWGLTTVESHGGNLDLDSEINAWAVVAAAWLLCGLLGVVIKACRRPRRIFRGGVVAVPVVIAGVLLGPIALYSAITNLDEDF